MRDIRIIISDLTSYWSWHTTRVKALKELEDMAKFNINALEAVNVIISCLENSDRVIRGKAAYALGNIAEKGKVDMSIAVEPLIRKLDDGNEYVRENIVSALGKIAAKGIVNMDREVEPLIRNIVVDLSSYWSFYITKLKALKKLEYMAKLNINALEAVSIIIHSLGNSDYMIRENAVNALKEIAEKGTVDMSRAVEPLIWRLEDGNEVVRGNAASALGKIAEKGKVDMARAVEPLIRKLEDGNDVVWGNAAGALGKIAEKGKVDMARAVEPLIRKLEDRNGIVSIHAVYALGNIAEKGIVDMARAVEPLISKLEDGNEYVRRYAAYALCKIAEKGTVDMSRAVEPLIMKLEDGNEVVRRNAAEALGKIAEKGIVDMSSAVWPLTKKLEDRNEVVKGNAAYALCKIAAKGTLDMSGAVEPLIRKLEDGNEVVRRYAAETLGKIAEKGIVYMSKMIADLTSYWSWHITKVKALKELEDMAKLNINALEAVSIIIYCLENSDYVIREKAAYALGKIADKGTVDMVNAVDPLIRKLEDSNEVVREKAAYALEEIAAKGTVDMSNAVDPLIRKLQDVNEVVRIHLTYTLGKIAEKGTIDMSRAVDPLISKLEDGNERVRGNAVYALREILEEGIGDMNNAVEPLIRKLNDANEVVRGNAASAIGIIAAKGTVDMSRVVELLMMMLEDSNEVVRGNAVEALGKMAAKGTVDMSNAVDPLISKLEDVNEVVRGNAASAIGIIAAKGRVDMRNAVDPLISKLEDVNEVVRIHVEYTLGKIAEKGTIDLSRAVGPLIGNLDDGNEVVVINAAYALRKIAEKRTVDMGNAVEPLIRKLGDGNEVVVVNAVYALREIAEKGTVDMGNAVEPLIRKLNDVNKLVMENAACALGNIAAKGTVDVSNAVEPLINMLNNSDNDVYTVAVKALREISEKSTIDINGEIGGLIYMLKDEEYKQLALFTLGEIVKKEGNYSDISLLTGKLFERRSVHAAKFCLNELIKRRKVDVNKLEPILYELMKHKDSCINVLAAQILVSIGSREEQQQGMDCIMDRLTYSQEAAVYAIIALKELGDSYVMKAVEAFKIANPKLSRLADECIKEIYQREEMLSRVWRGKYGESKFIPVAMKPGGCQPGAIYEKEHTRPGNIGPRKQWIGKADNINRKTVKEKISSDIYGFFGVTVPKTRLAADIEVGNKFTAQKDGTHFVSKEIFRAMPQINADILWQELITNGYLEKLGKEYKLTSKFNELQSFDQMKLSSQFKALKESVYNMLQQGFLTKSFFYEQGKNAVTFIMSKYVQGYNNLGEHFIEEIAKNEGRPPDRIFVSGKDLELRGLMKGLAVAKFLGDTDFLGGKGENAGFIIKPHEHREYAEFIKIDPGDAFNFDTSSRVGTVESLVNDLEIPGRKMVNSKNMFIGNNYPHHIIFNKLSTQQRDELIGTMEKIVEISDKKIERIVRRAGELGKTGGGLYKGEEDRIIEQLKGRRDLMKRLYGADIARYKYSKIQNMSRSSEQMLLV